MTEGPVIGREELLSGRFQADRWAQKIFSLIDSRIAYVRSESRRAIQAHLFEGSGDYARHSGHGDYLEEIKRSLASPYRLDASDLERHVRQWQDLVPRDAAVRASLLRIIGSRLRLDPASAPRTSTALGLGDPEVRAAYERAHGEPVEALLEARIDAAQTPASAPVSPEEQALAEVDASLEWLTLESGSLLFEIGDESDCLYVVISGRLRVVLPRPDGGETVAAELGRGEMVGEMGVLTGEPRSARVYTVRDSELVRLSAETLRRLAQHHPAVMLRLNRVLAQRLRSELSRTRRRPDVVSTIALVPVTAGIDTAGLAAGLAAALRRYGATHELDRRRLEAEFEAGATDLAPGDPDEPRLLAWLSGQEAEHAFLLYEADASPSDWTRRCIRQADRVLFVADARRSPVSGDLEREIVPVLGGRRADLLLVHPPGTSRPSRTADWLEYRDIGFHYHLEAGLQDDIERLARMLSGNAVGVVFSGGGARGFAHIGVMRALAEARIPVDLIGGTSMGALIGGIFALGFDYETCLENARVVASRARLLDPTLPIVSVFAGRKVTTVLRSLAGDTDIRDLRRPFFCISSNITRAEPVVHTAGPLWKALRASTAIPSMMAPVLDGEGSILVDGAVMNNFPLDVMQDLYHPSVTIGVNVSPLMDDRTSYDFGDYVSGWDVLLGMARLKRRRVRAPSLFSVAMRTNEVRSTHRLRSPAFLELADLLIEPSVVEFPMLDFGRWSEIVEAGYRATKDALESRLAVLPPALARVMA